MVSHDQRHGNYILKVVKHIVRDYLNKGKIRTVHYQVDGEHKCPQEIGRRVDDVNSLHSARFFFQHGAKEASGIDHKKAQGDSQGDR